MKGGKRQGAGRPKGAVSQATKDIQELAKEHGPAAVKRAAHLMLHAESEDTQLRAAQFIVERGYGKAKELHDHKHAGGISIRWMTSKS